MHRTAPLALALFLAGCPHPTGAAAPHAVVDSPAVKPSDDVTAAGTGGAAGGSDAGTDDHRLGVQKPKVTDLDVVHVKVVGHDANGDPILESKTPGPLLDAGNDAFAAGKLDEAVKDYRQLATEFSDSALAPSALYNIALVAEKRNDLPGALTAYLELYDKFPASSEATEGMLRVAAIDADASHYPEAEHVLATLDGRDDLARETRLEVEARLGYVILEQGRLDDAEKALNDAVDTWRKASHVDDPYYIAMANFYLGEVASKRFAKLVVHSADQQLSQDMHDKRALLLAAYDRWKEALTFKQAYWATAAGYEMSQIFYEYWKAAVSAPFPDGMKVEARPMYVAKVHDEVREDLKKALDGHNANVELAAAYGVTTSWSDASKQRAAEILAILDQEARGKPASP